MFDNCKNKQELNAQMNYVAAGKEALIALDKIADDVKIIVSQYKLKETELENKEQMTNEEWFVTLSTEEKAKVMVEETMRNSYITKKYYEQLIGELTDWLKQLHSADKKG